MITEFEGKTLISVTYFKNLEELAFLFSDNSKYVMFHEQDCCESVYLEDGFDDLKELVGQEILQAYVTTNNEISEWGDSTTWTYYTINTFYGSASLRWVGESNGYYSESVSLERVN